MGARQPGPSNTPPGLTIAGAVPSQVVPWRQDAEPGCAVSGPNPGLQGHCLLAGLILAAWPLAWYHGQG